MITGNDRMTPPMLSHLEFEAIIEYLLEKENRDPREHEFLRAKVRRR